MTATLSKLPGSLRLRSARCNILSVCSELEERQVSSSIGNVSGVAGRVRLMTVSVATATGSVLEIQYLYPPIGVKFPCGRVHVRCVCIHPQEWMDKALITGWLQSIWPKIVGPCIERTPGYCVLI